MEILWEGLFLEEAEVLKAIQSLRLESPFKKTPKDYHVTTEFKPAETHENLYGEKAIVTATLYQKGLVTYREKETGAEGFLVEIKTENPELQKVLSINRKWHITTSFEDWAVTTNLLNFEKGEKVCFIFEATFGGFDVESNKPFLGEG